MFLNIKKDLFQAKTLKGSQKDALQSALLSAAVSAKPKNTLKNSGPQLISNLLRQGPHGEEVSVPFHLLTSMLTARFEGNPGEGSKALKFGR